VYWRQWNEAMTLCGLVKTYDGGKKLPKLLKVRCTAAADEVTLRMPRGQSPEIYHKASVNLAHSFDTRSQPGSAGGRGCCGRSTGSGSGTGRGSSGWSSSAATH
jgi:S-DNA-T family DNA segregation ATPase FtsK/SpoIIIE